MTIAGKINLLVAAGMLLAGGIVLLITGHSRLELQRELLMQRATAEVGAALELPHTLYQRNSKAAAHFTQSLMAISDAAEYALLMTPSGDVLAQQQHLADADYNLPAVADLRTLAGPLDTSVADRSYLPPGGEDAAFSGRFARVGLTDVVIPVLGTLNPLQPGLQESDFGRALLQAHSADSLHVSGYVLLGINRDQLRLDVVRQLVPFAGAGLVLALLAILLSSYLTKRFSSPMARLNQVAADIASGNFDHSIRLQEPGEFRELSDAFNTIMQGLNEHRARLDIDHQLLSMKVEERTEQLSRRNVELNRAVQQITLAKDRLRKLAYFDSLTSLPNRRLLIEQLELLVRTAKRNKQIIALLFLDLDNFKRINDSLGHTAGDQLLREVARRLVQCVRDSDLISHTQESESQSQIDVSRLGGDEFTVVLNQIERAESAGVVAKRLLDKLVEPITVDGQEIVVTPSIGIAIAPRDATNVTELLKAADTAMYQAKARGKNNYLFYDSDMQAESLQRLRLESDLRRALERDELSLHYQPQVDCKNGDIVGAEALLRWEHPELGPISPARFVPMAEEIGLIGELGCWTLRRACRELVELDPGADRLPKVSVNVSALQFNQAFIQQVREVLDETRLAPERLSLELTEGIAMDDTLGVIRGLAELKSLGVGLSIDDFGTGYSSLSYLSRFPLDELKIDRSFVEDCDKGDAATAIISAIIAMATSMDLHLIAEGVESREQFQFLLERGVPVIQGYLFCKPVPAQELDKMLVRAYFMPQLTDLTGAGLRALR